MNIEQVINYEFKNKRLLEQSLSPPILRKKKIAKAFERLEFLGDRILGLVIAEALYSYFPNSSEGDLAKRISYLTSRELCHKIGEKLKIYNYLDIPLKEIQSTSIIANTMEALIAAVYVDSGSFTTAQKFILNIWQEALEQLVEPPKDYKSSLQEWAQKRGLAVPLYTEKNRLGPDHAPEYELEVSVETGESCAGVGKNKKAAEQNAAKKLLTLLQNKKPPKGSLKGV